MPRFQLFVHPDDPEGLELPVSTGEALLQGAHMAWGQVSAPVQGAASDPRLRHARALIELERRFGEADHVWRVSGQGAGDAGSAAASPGPDEDQVLLVTQGRCTCVLPAPARRGWLACTWDALEWFARPQGSRLRALPDREPRQEGVEWLVLSRHRRRGVQAPIALEVPPQRAPQAQLLQAAEPLALRGAEATLAGALA